MDGCLVVSDRKEDRIISGVREAAVIGVADDKGGELVTAPIVTEPAVRASQG